jgi:hypothetical protein
LLFQWQVGAAVPNFEQPRTAQAGMECMYVTWPKTDSSRNTKILKKKIGFHTQGPGEKVLYLSFALPAYHQ